MGIEYLLDGLRTLFAGETAARLLAALRQDALVWAAFMDEGFTRKALVACGDDIRAWTPGVLALAGLDEERIAPRLKLEPMQPLESGLRQRAVRTYEDARRRGAGPASLNDAGLLGLALRERRRYTGSWKGLADELLTSPSGVKAISPRTWKTALACLSDYIPDSVELMEALLAPENETAGMEWATHIFLCQTGDVDEQAAKACQLLRNQPVTFQLSFLKGLHVKKQAALTQKAAGLLLSGHPAFQALNMNADIDALSTADLAARALQLQQMAAFQALSGSPNQAEATLKEAHDALHLWQAGLKIQSLELTGRTADENELVEILEDLSGFNGGRKRLQSRAGAVISKRLLPQAEKLAGLPNIEDAHLMLSRAEVLFRQGKTSLAQEIGHEAAIRLTESTASNGFQPGDEYVFTPVPAATAKLLDDLQLTEDAAAYTEAALEATPADPELVDIAGSLQEKLGNLGRARELALFSAGMHPASLEHYQRLAGLCEKLEDWQQAFHFRKACLEMDPDQALDNRIAYAETALQAGHVDEAAETCETILAETPDQEKVHGLLGLVRSKQGRDEEAILHLNRATLISPDDEKWWLALADQQKKMGDERTALDTLRAAVLAAPESGAVHYSLGEMYINSGMNAEALPHLKRAAALSPGNSKIAFRLAKALHLLGFLADARRVIDGMRLKWAAQPEVAYEYAQIALSLGDIDAAIPALDAAARAECAQPEWLATYANLLLDDGVHSAKLDESSRYFQAEVFLRKSLELTPGDLKTRITLAEALFKQGKTQDAYQQFQELVELPEAEEQNLLWRIQHGFGLAAVAMGQVEPGIILLREAAQKQPEMLALQQDLAEACLSADLNQDAAEAAESALALQPDDGANLDWFARMMVKLGNADRAAEALRCAIDLTPENIELRVRYAQLELESGHLQDAQDALRKLPELDGSDPQVLRQAAYLYLRMQDPAAAIENLEKAVMLSDQPPADLLYDLATVYSQNDRLEDAIQTIQRAADQCRDIRMHVFHADLLARQNRFQAALLAVERAQKLVQMDNTCDNELLPGIYERSACWNRELGNVASALEQAEKALEYSPEDFKLRFLAADLALAMLQDEKAGRYAMLPFEAANRADMDADGVALACLSAHLALDAGRIDDAQGLYAVCHEIAPEEAWVRTLGARLLARKGEIRQAAAEVTEIISAFENDQIHPGDPTLWAAQAAAEVYLWAESFRLYDTYLSKFSTEHRASYLLARALVEAAEAQRLCEDLEIKAHAPGIDAQQESYLQRFEEVIGTIKPLINPDEAARWQIRAKLAVGPSLEGVRSLAATTCSAMDTAAVMASLRMLKNPAGAIEAAKTSDAEAPVTLQKALALGDSDPACGLSDAETLLASAPEHPVYLAACAKLANLAGQVEYALDKIEQALAIWPDEARWQALAAGLYDRLNDPQSAIQHWQAALALEPANAAYMVSLGEAFYKARDYALAAETLSKAIALDGKNPAAWLGLAQAQDALGQAEEAISSAIQASELDASSAAGLALASQICQRAGMNEQALTYARESLKRDPDDVNAIVNLSRVLNQQGKLVESLEVIEQSIDTLQPDQALLFERARLIHQMSGASAAAELANQLVEAYPENAEILALHATIQAELGDLKAAERSAFRSLRLRPNQPDLAIALGRMTRKAGQLDQSVHLLSQAVHMSPDNIEAYLELGQAYIDRREHQQALQTFMHATRVAPRDPRGYFQAALILKETKDYPGAEAMLEQAAKYAPDDLQIHRQLVGVMALNLIHKSQEANTAL